MPIQVFRNPGSLGQSGVYRAIGRSAMAGGDAPKIVPSSSSSGSNCIHFPPVTILSSLLVEQLDPAHVTAPFKISFQPHAHNFQRVFFRNHSLAKRNHVRIVVLPRETR